MSMKALSTVDTKILPLKDWGVWGEALVAPSDAPRGDAIPIK
jgi:hypothetical protein